jgi:DNA-3-methyladenine glycosylase II
MCFDRKSIDEADAILVKDKNLAPVIKKVSLDIQSGTNDVYNYLIRVIIFQQLSGKAAETIYNRFLDIFPKKNPEMKLLLATDHEQLRRVGLSNQKARYVKNIAYWFKENDPGDWNEMRDKTIKELLLPIKGIGPWTIDMLLMFGLCRPDIMPQNDLGITKAILQLYGLRKDDKNLKKKMEKITSRWKPFRSIACLYLWRYLDDQKKK